MCANAVSVAAVGGCVGFDAKYGGRRICWFMVRCNKTGRWPALFLTLSLTLWRSLHYITLLYITLGRSFGTLLYSTLPWGDLFITLHYSTLLGTLFFTLLYMCALYGGRW